jgi:hypothetical protein
MKKEKFIPVFIIGILALGCIWFLIHNQGPRDIPAAGDQSPAGPKPSQPVPPAVEKSRPAEPVKAAKTEVAAYHPKDIEEIKKQVYDLNIEYVEDLPKLESVIQTGNAATKDFWHGNWASVDDNKADINGFYLRPQEDGTFVYFPDENSTKTYTFFETPQTYAYDPARKEFYWDIDYYGKTISHRVRFINDNVVAMMLISGRKVVLDLYQKQKDPD